MIIISTYGKVGSTSLHEMLKGGDEDVFYTHGLSDRTTSQVERFLASTRECKVGLRNAFAANPHILRRLAEARRSGEEVTVISGVRDPIQRSLSVAVQLLNLVFSDCLAESNDAIASRLAQRVARAWTVDPAELNLRERYAADVVRSSQTWLTPELEELFGFDLGAQPFDIERGYQTYTSGNARLLLFRFENLPGALEAGLDALLPGRASQLPRHNVTRAKPAYPIHRLLQQTFRLAAADLKRIYAHKHTRWFYSDADIDAAIERWSSEPSPQRRAERSGPVVAGPASRLETASLEPRGTVVLSVHNHRVWVGEQLDSLRAQWRPDLKLLVIDDGSTDDSLQVVQKRLAQWPAVNATVLRNEKPLVLGNIANLRAHIEGDVIVQVDSDDLTLPGRLDAIITRFDADPECGFVGSNAILLSPTGLPIGIWDPDGVDVVCGDPVRYVDEWLSIRCHIGATAAFHRRVFDHFEELNLEQCPYGLDMLTPMRAVLTGNLHYIARPLVGWRQHPGNTHRLMGSKATSDVERENYGALELMALAQRLRDLNWVRAQKPDDAELKEASERAHGHFLDHFGDWSAVRTRSRSRPAPDRGAQVETMSVPPVVSLEIGRAYPFGATALGSAASCWPGFYRQEAALNWTARRALLVVRLPSDAKALILTLRGWRAAERVRVVVNFGAPVEVILSNAVVDVEVPVCRAPLDGLAADGMASLFLEAPEAISPSTISGDDRRVIGAALHGLRVV